MPASRSSSMSCQRLAWRLPSALVCASSSTSSSCGLRCSARSRSNSRTVPGPCSEQQEGNRLESLEQPLGFRAPVRLDIADDDVDAFGLLAPRRLEHRVGLADAGRRAEEDLQLAAARGPLLRLHVREQGIGIGAAVFHCSSVVDRAAAAGAAVGAASSGPCAQPTSASTNAAAMISTTASSHVSMSFTSPRRAPGSAAAH